MFGFKVPQHPLAQFFFVIFIAITSLFLILAISVPVAYWIYGPVALDFDNLNNLSNPKLIEVSEYYQVIQSVAMLLIPPFFLAWWFSGNIKSYLGLNRTVDYRQITLILLISFSVMPFINLLAEYNAQIHFPDYLASFEQKLQNDQESVDKVITTYLNVSCIQALLFNIFMVAILPAVSEELMFRGILQRIFTNMSKNPHLGIIISSFIFSAIHFQFYGLIPRWFLGMIFGYLYLWSGSIWAPIIGHFINNVSGVIGYYMANNGNISKDTLDTGSTYNALPVTFMFTMIFIVACYYYAQYSKQRIQKIS